MFNLYFQNKNWFELNSTHFFCRFGKLEAARCGRRVHPLWLRLMWTSLGEEHNELIEIKPIFGENDDI